MKLSCPCSAAGSSGGHVFLRRRAFTCPRTPEREELSGCWHPTRLYHWSAPFPPESDGFVRRFCCLDGIFTPDASSRDDKLGRKCFGEFDGVSFDKFAPLKVGVSRQCTDPT